MSSRKSMYLIAGGQGADNLSLLREALKQAGKVHPSVAYIGTANGESKRFLAFMNDMLIPAGAGDVKLVKLLGTDSGSPEARETLIKSDVIFVSGGEVEDGMNGIPKDVRVLLRQLYEEGKLFTGISAGTIMLGIAWPHWDDEDNRPEDAILFDCLGFAPYIFDTHYEAMGWTELKKAVELSPEGYIGYGIPTGGMAVIYPDGSLHPTIPLDMYKNINGEAVYTGKFEG